MPPIEHTVAQNYVLAGGYRSGSCHRLSRPTTPLLVVEPCDQYIVPEGELLGRMIAGRQVGYERRDVPAVAQGHHDTGTVFWPAA